MIVRVRNNTTVPKGEFVTFCGYRSVIGSHCLRTCCVRAAYALRTRTVRPEPGRCVGTSCGRRRAYAVRCITPYSPVRLRCRGETGGAAIYQRPVHRRSLALASCGPPASVRNGRRHGSQQLLIGGRTVGTRWAGRGHTGDAVLSPPLLLRGSSRAPTKSPASAAGWLPFLFFFPPPPPPPRRLLQPTAHFFALLTSVCHSFSSFPATYALLQSLRSALDFVSSLLLFY